MPKKQWKYDDPIKVEDAKRWEDAIYNRVEAGWTGTYLTATLKDFVFEDMAELTIKLPINIPNGAALSVNGGAAIGLYTTNGIEVLQNAAAKGAYLTCRYNEDENRFYIEGISNVTASTIINASVQRERFLGDGTTKTFNFVNGSYVMGQNRILLVTINAAPQLFGDSYIENSPTSITFSEPPPFDGIIDVIYIEHFYGDHIDYMN